jgi:ubiquinol-cytochrome c reductase cytochrome b subunit
VGRHDTSLLGATWSLLRTPIPPERRGVFAFGWLILLLFCVQAVTGILLSIYYEDSPATAAASVRLVMRDVDSGWLVRGIHHWNATFIVALSLMQLFRALVTRSYSGQGSASWYIGCVLLVLTFAEAFSGQLLPWDAQAHATIVHSLDAIERVPLAGPALASLLRGGSEVTGYTLSRIHTAHVLVLPWASTFLIAIHLWLFGRRRLARPER